MVKEKKINMDWAVLIMTCLKFVLDKTNILGFLHLDVEGWEAYALHGAIEAVHGVDNT